jgi:predicted enzyme related to lactoylglutathione lyase
MDVIDVGRMAVLVDPVEAVIAVWQARQHIGASIQGDEGTFAWTELTTRDPDTALPFYEAVFGWKANREPGYTEFELDGRSVAGCMEMPASVPADVPSSWMPYFAAADPQGKASQAEKLGATVLVPFTEVANVAFTVVADPQQARFGLLHLTQH